MTLSADERAAIEARLREDDDWLRQEIAAGSNAMVFGRTYMEQRHADRRALRAALVAAEARAKALAEALDFQASVKLEGGFHGGDLLRAVAEYMDKIDDARGGDVDRQVQFDLRRWSDDVDAALAADREPAG